MDSKTKSGIENQNIKDFSTNILSKKIFTCTICEKMLSPPIILDEEFGNICQCCFENRLGAKKGIRNTDLELILGELVIPCTFNCATFITHKDLKDHQMTCKFRPLNCLFDDCKWKGVTNKFVKHFTQYHKDEILDSENNIYILNFCLGNNDDVTIKLLNDITRPCIIKIEKFVESDQILYTMYNAKDCEYNNTWNYTIAHYGTICKPVTIQCEVQPIRTIFDNKNKQTQVNISTLKSTIGADALVTLILKSPENDLLLKKIKECLECPVCNNLMRPPIYQCTTGHSFCNGCKPRLHNCPACRASMGNGRNFGLENLTNQVPYECKYNWRDCEEILFLQDLKKHEEICPFQPQQTDQNVQSSGPARSQASSTEIGVEECPRLSPSRERRMPSLMGQFIIPH